MLRLLIGFVIAWPATAALGSIALSIARLAQLSADVGPIPLSDSLNVIAQDLTGFAPLFAVLLGMSCLVFFAIGIGLGRLVKPARMAILIAAGALAAIAVPQAIEAATSVPAIPSAATPIGLLALALVGAAGGAMFAALTRPRA